MKNQIALFTGITLAAMATTAVALSPVPPQERFCGIYTLKGTYAYSGYGVVKETGAPGAAFVQAGMESYDGKGHVVGYGSDKTSATDDASNKRFAGTYTVNPDCTGTLTYEEAGQTLEENIYVNPDGDALRYLSRTQGQFWAGEEQRISRKLIVK